MEECSDPAPHALKATLDAAKAQFDLCIIDTPPAAPEWLALYFLESGKLNDLITAGFVDTLLGFWEARI